MTSKILSIAFVLITGTAFSQTDSASLFLQKGLLEKQNGRRLESLKNFEKAEHYNKSDKAIISELASAYFDLRQYAKSLSAYKKLNETGDQSPETLKQIMQLSFNLKQNDDALKYAQLLKKADPSQKVNYFIAKINYDNDNYGEALKALSAAMKEGDTNPEIPYMAGRSFAEMQNYRQAVEYFKKAIEMDTTRNFWAYELGLIYYGLNDNANALKYIKLAADRGYKKDADYMKNLGIAYLNTGNLDEGVKVLSEILVKRPGDLSVLDMIGEAYYDNGKYQKAIDYWDEILFYDKENAQALYMIGMAYQKKGEKDKGQAMCDRAIQMDPKLGALKSKVNMGM
jgi:tetratricopeptide (TPR) repeat protein